MLLLAAPGLGGCAHPVSAPAQPKPKPQLTVLVSGAFEPALRRLAPIYERRSGVHLVIVGGPSMGASPTAIPQRLERGEAADVVILAREALDRLAKAGKVAPGSEQDLVLSKIALAVKAGTPVPGIATVPALRATLLSAKSVAYSDSASGVYVSTQLFAKLGIAEAMAGKARMIEATPVGLIVARGEAELGFQQLSELKPIAGIRIVGLLPEEIQKTTRFSAGLVAYSTQPEAGTRLIAFLRSGAARGAMVESGLQPVR
ncbi:MAG: substrate-binding domain-containing protein [Sphingomonas sp.]|nr:substrate-binding domain-containing protein [Sphingomonas sp.]